MGNFYNKLAEIMRAQGCERILGGKGSQKVEEPHQRSSRHGTTL